MYRIDKKKIRGWNDIWRAPAPFYNRNKSIIKPNYLISPSFPMIPNRPKKQLGREIFNIAYPKPKLIGKTKYKHKGLPIFSIATPLKIKKPKVSNPFMINSGNKFKGIARKDLRWPQISGNPKYKNINPWVDTDKDGVINMFDCRPFDPRRQEDLPKGEWKSKSGVVKRITKEEFDRDRFGRLPGEKAQQKNKKIDLKTDFEIERLQRKAADIESASDIFQAREESRLQRQAEDTEEATRDFKERQRQKKMAAQKQKESDERLKIQKEKTKTAGKKSKSDLAKEGTKQMKISTRYGKWMTKQQQKQYDKELKAKLALAKLEASDKTPRKWGTLKSLARTREDLATRREGWNAEIEKNKRKIQESNQLRTLYSLEAAEKNPVKKAILKKDIEELKQKGAKTISVSEKKRLNTDIEYKEMKTEKATKARAALGNLEEKKKRWEMTKEKMGLGWVPGATSATKERLKAGFQRYKHEKEGKVFTKRAMGLLGALTSTGGMMGVESNVFGGFERVGKPIRQNVNIVANEFEEEAKKQEQYDRAYAADQAKKAGRPFGSFKYGMPIQEYKQMQRNLARQEQIQMAMAQAQKAAELQAQTDKVLSGGTAYASQTGPVIDYSQYQIQPTQQVQQTSGTALSQSYPGMVMSEPSAALGSSIPQYNQGYDAAPIDLTQGGPMNLAQTNRNIVEKEWNGYDLPTRSTANKSMTTTQLHAMPNIYGDANPDPRFARIPTLPVDPAMIREDDLPREYYADEAQAEQVRLASEQQFRPDFNRGSNPSLQGDVTLQYAAKKRDLRAPTVKSMVLQTQNDGQRKIMPTIKANPWGLQLKNRINFSENNILESDLKGNVVSKDAIGGQILQAPNVFKNNATFNYNPARNPSPLGGNRNPTMPSSTGVSPQMRQMEMIKRQQAMQLAQRQRAEATQPSFLQKVITGQPLRPPKPISRSAPSRKPSIFDKIKTVVSGVDSAEQRAQQALAQEQEYIDQTQVQQAIEPAGVAMPQEEVAINMTEEEFNALSVEDQQRVIEASQSSQQQQEQQQMSIEEQTNLQALQEEQTYQPQPSSSRIRSQQPVPGPRGGSGYN